jgi:hypothetical protein
VKNKNQETRAGEVRVSFPQSRKREHMTSKIILPLLLLPLGLAAQTPSTQPQSPSSTPAPAAPSGSTSQDVVQELHAKQQELQTVAQEIDSIQARAESADGVKASRRGYRDALTKEMIQAAPDMEQSINRRAALVDELIERSAKTEEAKDASADDQRAKLTELQELGKQLQPVETRAQQAESVQTARKTYYDTLIAEMQRIEPKTQDLLTKHQQLSGTVRELATRASQRG